MMNLKPLAYLGCFSLILAMSLPSIVLAQGFDVEAYLKRIDSNRNGSLESNEMNGRTRDFIAKMGFNVDKPVSIRKVVSKVNKDRARREKEEKQKNAPALKVPGFAPDSAESTSSTAVVGFTNATSSGGDSSKSSRSAEYSDDIKRRVSDVLSRYDKNKNGLLESDEIKDARWGSPSPQASDKNRDGKLTRDELSQRYLDRERYSNRERNRSSGRESSSNSKEDEERKRRAREREQFQRSSSSSTPRRSSGSSSSGSSSSKSDSSSAKPKVDRAKYESYVDGLMERYDKNKNGKFDKDELKEMRRPPMDADVDKDGAITRSELIDKLTGVTKASPEKPGSPSKSSTERSRRFGSKSSDKTSSRPSSRSTSRSRGSFGDLDKNQDGRIHMHEFSEEWTEEIVNEFQSKDKNDDGILVESEWRS